MGLTICSITLIQRWYNNVCLEDVALGVGSSSQYGRGSFPGLGGLKETKMFLPDPLVKLSIVGNLLEREVACSASKPQGLNFKSCVWRAVSSHSSHHPQQALLAQFSLHVHKSGLKLDSFIFSCQYISVIYTDVQPGIKYNAHAFDIFY